MSGKHKSRKVLHEAICPSCEVLRMVGANGTCRSCSIRAKHVARLGTTVDRFWRNVDRESAAPCWIWTGAKGPLGYGRFGDWKRIVLAHRFSYELHIGQTPLNICHHCDNPSCVRPEHLYAGTAAENSDDMRRRFRSTIGERNKHAKLTDATVREILAALDRGERQARIGRRVGVTASAISHIARGHTWTHLTRDPEIVALD